jgi:5'-nucleotidase
MRGLTLAVAALALAGCAARSPAPRAAAAVAAGPVEVHVIAFNDFHGNLQPPGLSIDVPGADGRTVAAPAGGAAWLAATIADIRAKAPSSITVSAGDMTGASPIESSLFLDEPTVAAMNLIGVDLNAAGNHEFDRGITELHRLQDGGCAKTGGGIPCRIDRFAGAKFEYLAGNTITADGRSAFPATAIREFRDGARVVRIGFIGLTTRTTTTLVNPAGIPGIRFADEADTANAQIAGLRTAGADAIVLLIHEGGAAEGGPNDCTALSGAIRPILARLDTRVDLVVSGHTHRSYICDYAAYDPARPFLLTSAGKYGTLVTDAVLAIDPASHRVVARHARNIVVQNDGYVGADGQRVAATAAAPRLAPEPRVGALVARYAAAAAPLASRTVGRLTMPLPKASENAGMTETRLGNLIADAQLAATRAAGAQIALMNPFGIRTSLNPDADGRVTYSDLYAVQPFGNTLMIRAYTGAQLRAVLEQQLDRKIVLAVAGLGFGYDRSRPAGSRILDPRVGGVPLDDRTTYRVTLNNFLAFGGDGFSTLTAGRDVGSGPSELDALSAYLDIGRPVVPPMTGRIVDRTPAG